jgi:adhesin/invasin
MGYQQKIAKQVHRQSEEERCGMGRCGGWMKIIALVLAVFTASCGGTGGKSSDSGNPFVFQTRGRLDLRVQPVSNTPTALEIIASLLDPQGNPFRNQIVTFSAEFQDVTIVPVLGDPRGNQGVAITDDLGQARVTLIAGLTTGNMRLIAEAPANLNIASAISVNITNQGFIGGTALAILPTSLTFTNPQVEPGRGTMAVFSAIGGTPPYRWDNTNKDLARIDPQGIQNINQQATYTLIGPIPTDTAAALLDTVILIDSTGARVTAPVTVIFADCTLQLSSTEITLDSARPRDEVAVTILNGVPPFTVSHTFPAATAPNFPSVNDTGTITYRLPDPVVAVPAPGDTVIVRDSRGCIGTFTVTIIPGTVETIILTANPTSVPAEALPETVTITATAFDDNNQPFEDVTLLFTTTGGILSAVSAPTDVNGRATVTLTIPAGTEAGSIEVTATAPGGATATVTITIEPPPEPPAS